VIEKLEQGTYFSMPCLEKCADVLEVLVADLLVTSEPGPNGATHSMLAQNGRVSRTNLVTSEPTIQPVGEAIYADLQAATDELEQLLLPLRGTIGNLSLSEPEDQRWFPYRPGSVAEEEFQWNPSKSGKWEDAWYELTWIDGGTVVYRDGDRMQLVFYSGHYESYFEALYSPAKFESERMVALDCLDYLRRNMPRLLRLIQKRIDLLHANGFIADYEAISGKLHQLEQAYPKAGKGVGGK
jgi:hypothetical protein